MKTKQQPKQQPKQSDKQESERSKRFGSKSNDVKTKDGKIHIK